MAKGYWMGFADITDLEGYKAYVAANAEPFRKYGARFLVRGGKSDPVEGNTRSRALVIEFPSYADAVACYQSPEYNKAKALRQGKSIGDVAIVEGYDGPQPGGG